MSDNRFASEGVVAREERLSKWLDPASVVKGAIVDIELFSASSGTPGLKVTIHSSEKFEELKGDGRKVEENWWLSEKAFEFTQQRIVLIADKLGLRDALNKATATAQNNEQYAEAVSGVLKDVEAHWLIGGEHTYIKDDNGKYNLWIKPRLHSFGFVDAANTAGLENLTKRLNDVGDKIIKEVAPPEDYDGGGDATKEKEEIKW